MAARFAPACPGVPALWSGLRVLAEIEEGFFSTISLMKTDSTSDLCAMTKALSVSMASRSRSVKKEAPTRLLRESYSCLMFPVTVATWGCSSKPSMAWCDVGAGSARRWVAMASKTKCSVDVGS